MDEVDFDGTRVLEVLAGVRLLEDFWEAIDADDAEAAKRLMRTAGVGADEIGFVLEKIAAADGEH